jgi:hypothetical protein
MNRENRPNGRQRRTSALRLRRPETKVWNELSQHQPAQSPAMSRDNTIFRVWQIVELGPLLTSSNVVPSSTGLSFTINQMPQAATWLSAFDQYKIEFLELWITTTSSVSLQPDASRWYSVIDYDDDGTSITEAQIQQYGNVTDCNRSENVYRKFRPHIALSVNATGGAALARNAPSDWIDSAANSVKHFGLKLFMQVNVNALTLNLRGRYHVAFRNVF